MKNLTIQITDLEYAALADIVVDPREWARGAVRGKTHMCVEKVVAKEQARLLADPTVETIPASVDGILESHFAQPDYKNREERDLAEAATRAAQLAALRNDSP
jgi:hypothetical protein